MSTRPWSAASPLRKSSAAGSAGTTPTASRPSTAHGRISSSQFLPTARDVEVDRRVEVREWTALDLRERLLHAAFFRDTIIASAKTFTADGEERGIGPCSLADALFAHRVDGATFVDMTQDDLAKYIGVRQLGVIKAIIREVQTFLQRPPARATLAPAAKSAEDDQLSIVNDDDDEDPYSAAWAAARITSSRPQSAVATTGIASPAATTAKRPQTAAYSRASLDPFVKEQRRFVPDIITPPLRRASRSRAEDDEDGRADDAWEARSAASSQRLRDLLEASRQRRARALLRGANTKSAAATVITDTIQLQTRLHDSVASGLVCSAPWQHDQIHDFIGPELSSPPTEVPHHAGAATTTEAKPSTQKAELPPRPASAILAAAALRQKTTEGVAAEGAADDAEASGFTPGIMERERRFQRFTESYRELLLGMENGVNLGCGIQGMADVLEWDATFYESSVNRAYAAVRNARAAHRRRKQIRAMGGEVQAVDDELNDPTAAVVLTAPASPNALAKHEALIVTEAEFRNVMCDLNATHTPAQVDQILKHLSNLFGDAQRERVRRSRDIDGALRGWDVAKEGTVTALEFNEVLLAFNNEIASVADTLQIQYAWSDDITPYYVGSTAKGGTTPSSPTSRRSPQAMQATSDPGPHERVRFMDIHPLFLNAWQNTTSDLFDEALLALKTAIDHATKDRLGLAAFATTFGEIDAAVKQLTHDKPVLVAYSTMVSPMLHLQVIAKNRGNTLTRLNVSSSASEDAAIETLTGKGLQLGHWIAMEFPRQAAAFDPLPIPPSLAALVEEEPVERDYRGALISRGGGRLSRAGSVSSAPSTGTSRATGVLDPYSGERYTGTMVAFLRRVAMTITTVPYFRRHEGFRLFCHAPVDFVNHLELPALLRPIARVLPLLGTTVQSRETKTEQQVEALRRAVSPQHVPTPGRLPSRLQRALASSATQSPQRRSTIDVDRLDETTPGQERRMAAALVATVLDFGPV